MLTPKETGSPTNLHEQTYQNLKTMIVEGAITPGSKLNERALAETLSVSRTPIREAIRRLAAAGLVELINNRGAIVPKLNKEDVLNAFELMAELEGFSGELAAKRITKEALSEIEALHYEMLACYSRKDLSGYYKLNSQIHQHINLAAGNPVFNDVASHYDVSDHAQAPGVRTELLGAGISGMKRSAINLSRSEFEIFTFGTKYDLSESAIDELLEIVSNVSAAWHSLAHGMLYIVLLAGCF